MKIRKELHGFRIYEEQRGDGYRLWACNHPVGKFCNCSDAGHSCTSDRRDATDEIIIQEIANAR